MVFPPKYFESPYLDADKVNNEMRPYYRVVDVMICILVKYSDNDGELWWF